MQLGNLNTYTSGSIGSNLSGLALLSGLASGLQHLRRHMAHDHLIFVELDGHDFETMASSRVWEFLGNGVRRLNRRENIAAWAVAGTAAYFLWVRPERKKAEERRVRLMGHMVECAKEARLYSVILKRVVNAAGRVVQWPIQLPIESFGRPVLPSAGSHSLVAVLHANKFTKKMVVFGEGPPQTLLGPWF